MFNLLFLYNLIYLYLFEQYFINAFLDGIVYFENLLSLLFKYMCLNKYYCMDVLECFIQYNRAYTLTCSFAHTCWNVTLQSSCVFGWVFTHAVASSIQFVLYIFWIDTLLFLGHNKQTCTADITCPNKDSYKKSVFFLLSSKSTGGLQWWI